MTIDYRSLHALILPALERCLVAIAFDRQCSTEELSFGVYRALETYGLDCMRAADQLAAQSKEDAAKSGLRPRVKAAGVRSTDPRKRAAAK